MIRLAIVAAFVALGCGGKGSAGPSTPAAPAIPESAKAYSATRFIPAKPAYVLAARTVRDAQRSIRDAIDGLGAIANADAAGIGRELEQLFAVDPLDPEALKSIGVDLEGGIAVFSESVNPTIVVRLASTSQTQGWIDTLRGRGLKTSSVMVDGVELFTARAGDRDDRHSLAVSWAIVDDWCWVHLHLPGVPDDKTAWFAPSRRPTAVEWAADWTYARDRAGSADPAFIGFFDLKRVVAAVVPRVPEVLACTKLLDPVERVAISVDGDTKRVEAKLSVELGVAGAALAKAVHPRPENWDAAAQSAAIAVQWNLDYPALRDGLQPCRKALDLDFRELDQLGVRAARAMVHSIDLDGPSGRGVAALELTSKRVFADLLDEIPLRRTLESKRSFGPHAGAQLSIPFGPKLDYVLTDELALAAMGDGLLAQVVGTGKRSPGPIAAIDIAPQTWSLDTWVSLMKLIDDDGWFFNERFVKLIRRWKAGHVSLGMDGSRLVLIARGTRL